MKLGFKKLVETATLPSYAYKGDSGMDIRSVENKTLQPGDHCLISTGISADIPDGYELQVRPRSGMAAKYGVQCSFGTVDSGYKGEIKVNLFNCGNEPYEVGFGDKVAQLVFAPVSIAEIVEVSDVGDSDRGAGGFGSTGK